MLVSFSESQMQSIFAGATLRSHTRIVPDICA